MNCKLCKQPMMVAPGQIAYYHRACRSEGRRLFGAFRSAAQVKIAETTPTVRQTQVEEMTVREGFWKRLLNWFLSLFLSKSNV